jgi:hypothetical protein
MYYIERAVGGITLNGTEVLLTDAGVMMVFETKEDAEIFLMKHGVPQKDLEFFNINELEYSK